MTDMHMQIRENANCENFFPLWLIGTDKYDGFSWLVDELFNSVNFDIGNSFTILELRNYFYSRNVGIETIEKLDEAYLEWKYGNFLGSQYDRECTFKNEQYQRECTFKNEQTKTGETLNINRVAIENSKRQCKDIPVYAPRAPPPMKG